MADDPKRIFGDDIATHSGARLVVRCLRNYPERLHEEFPFLVMDAFRDAWPCKRKSLVAEKPSNDLA